MKKETYVRERHNVVCKCLKKELGMSKFPLFICIDDGEALEISIQINGALFIHQDHLSENCSYFEKLNV